MKFLEYIRKVHSEGATDQPSSKRFYGGILLVCSQACLLAATVLSLINTGQLTETLKDLLEFDIITGASLVGLTTIMSWTKGDNPQSQNNIQQDNGMLTE